VSEPHEGNKPRESSLQAVVFVAGLLMVAIGLFDVIGPGAVVRGIAWIGAGAILQLASGLSLEPKRSPGHLVNPLRFLKKQVREVRDEVAVGRPR
jgi:hypothetical protein